jgi:hypothetical protein
MNTLNHSLAALASGLEPSHDSSERRPVYNPSPRQAQACSDMAGIIHAHVNSLLETLVPHAPPGGGGGGSGASPSRPTAQGSAALTASAALDVRCLYEGAAERFQEADLPFWSRFCTTQMVCRHYDGVVAAAKAALQAVAAAAPAPAPSAAGLAAQRRASRRSSMTSVSALAAELNKRTVALVGGLVGGLTGGASPDGGPLGAGMPFPPGSVGAVAVGDGGGLGAAGTGSGGAPMLPPHRRGSRRSSIARTPAFMHAEVHHSGVVVGGVVPGPEPHLGVGHGVDTSAHGGAGFAMLSPDSGAAELRASGIVPGFALGVLEEDGGDLGSDNDSDGEQDGRRRRGSIIVPRDSQ